MKDVALLMDSRWDAHLSGAHWWLDHMACVMPGLRFPSQPQNVTAYWLVPDYAAWWQRYKGVNDLLHSRTLTSSWSCDFLNSCPAPIPLHCYCI